MIEYLYLAFSIPFVVMVWVAAVVVCRMAWKDFFND
jgi:hypothetical protein